MPLPIPSEAVRDTRLGIHEVLPLIRSKSPYEVYELMRRWLRVAYDVVLADLLPVKHRLYRTFSGDPKRTASPVKGVIETHNKMATLETLNFDNRALRLLPVDKETKNRVRQVTGACFSLVEPSPVEKPQTVAVSRSALQLLEIPESQVTRDDFADYFSGNKLLPGSRPAAHCYCGHQFGYFSGQLGDGAAM